MESGKSLVRRDKLLEIEAKVRVSWEQSSVLKAESNVTRPELGEKLFGTFPYPYMNGVLHLGHAYSLSKLKFSSAYHRLRGANVLLPFAFHCTGMPIKVSADKLVWEVHRDSGEGVQSQYYTLIKMEVVPPFPPKLGPLEGKHVFLAAATLRPETMYGQANSWVLPDGKYGAFEINETGVFIITERATLNLAHQKLSKIPETPTCLITLTGHDLIGLPLNSSLSFNEIIYSLPMLTILTNKGTRIVTSVPSDSPDDYMALLDLKSKPALRAKFGVKDEWVLPFEVTPIINIPEFGDKAAEKVCIDLKSRARTRKTSSRKRNG
ncbi:hypothetical protein GIB67_001314 [Kingdonia uniflora]|uniref:leucine--tRNA ligase n=1 Tax=Kingdonia uniflora TaxID=39325 RepID=A0A7J7LLF2_9MAGN|nr:hypothetical protein GIB67_001314 [Kingdonia uniflora]